MNINRSKANTLKPMTSVNLSNNVSTNITGKIQSITNSSDSLIVTSTSASGNSQSYKELISPSLLSKFQNDPSFVSRAIEELHHVSQNTSENGRTRLKCEMLKMLFMEEPVQKVFGLRTVFNHRYRANINIPTPDKLISMMEYYLLGGLTLLRGLNLRAFSTLPASTMHSILVFFEKEKGKAEGITSGHKINTMLKKKIQGEKYFEGIDIANIPSATVINRFIANCGYKKNNENQWFFEHESTQSNDLPSTIANYSVNSSIDNAQSIDSISCQQALDEHSANDGFTSLMVRLNELAALQPSLKEVSEVIESIEESNDLPLQQEEKEEFQPMGESFLAMLHSPSTLGELDIAELSMSSSFQDENVKAHIEHLASAINNHSESDMNRIKFTAVKMKLENFSDKEIKLYCNSFFTNTRRKVNWNPKRLKLLTDYYLSGGLLMLRGFSFQTLPKIISAQTMGLLMNLVRQYPYNGSRAILKMASKIVSENELSTDVNAPILPMISALNKFITRCGYQRKERQWIFDSTLTPNIHSDKLPMLQVFAPYPPENFSKQAFKRKHSEASACYPYNKAKKTLAFELPTSPLIPLEPSINWSIENSLDFFSQQPLLLGSPNNEESLEMWENSLSLDTFEEEVPSKI